MPAAQGTALDGRAFSWGPAGLSPQLPAALVLGRRGEQKKEPLGLDSSSAPLGLESLSAPQVSAVGLERVVGAVCAYLWLPWGPSVSRQHILRVQDFKDSALVKAMVAAYTLKS